MINFWTACILNDFIIMFWVCFVTFDVNITFACVAFKFFMVVSNFLIADTAFRFDFNLRRITIFAFLWKFIPDDFVVGCYICEIAFYMSLTVTYLTKNVPMIFSYCFATESTFWFGNTWFRC